MESPRNNFFQLKAQDTLTHYFLTYLGYVWNISRKPMKTALEPSNRDRLMFVGSDEILSLLIANDVILFFKANEEQARVPKRCVQKFRRDFR